MTRVGVYRVSDTRVGTRIDGQEYRESLDLIAVMLKEPG
jgi:hypothetical protein